MASKTDISSPSWLLEIITKIIFSTGITLGRKAIGCFGGCDFHGINHNVYWTNLEETVQVGGTSIKLTEEVDWSVGDEIVITTTSYALVFILF